ncbi:zinc finger protein 316-like isoform X2 [Hyperolius riggenbachi]|uniref:zinc finger protein 316-like isoform X2 n=1 Tax=Hyperolius riggenbachi TaxID=752182 RepID=UPI0035A3645D
MDKCWSQMTERILNLILEVIYLLTGEHFPLVKSDDRVIITVLASHFLYPKRNNKQKMIDLLCKITELLTGEEWDHLEGHKEIYKDAMTENQPPLTSPDASSNRNPPERWTGPLHSLHRIQEEHNYAHQYQEWQYTERQRDLCKDTMMENQLPLTSLDVSSNRIPPERCTGPLYSQDYTQEDHSYGKKQMDLQAEVTEEEEEGDMMRTIKEEEEETYVTEEVHITKNNEMSWTIAFGEREICMRLNKQSAEEGAIMRTIHEKEQETYMGTDQQTMEEGDMMGTVREKEQETYVRTDQQIIKEGDMMRPIKEEEEETYVTSDQQSMEEGDMMRTIKEEEEETEEDNYAHCYQGDKQMDVQTEEEEETILMDDLQTTEKCEMRRTNKAEEEETSVRSDNQSTKEGDVMRTIKEEKELYVTRDQQTMQEGDFMTTIKEEEEETYVRSDQQSMEEGDMRKTIIEEKEETYMRSDESIEKGDVIGTSKEEEEETYVRNDQQTIKEGDMMTIEEEETYVRSGQLSTQRVEMGTLKREEFSPDISAGGDHVLLHEEQNNCTQHPQEGNLVAGHKSHQAYPTKITADLTNSEESSDRPCLVTPNTSPGLLRSDRPLGLSNSRIFFVGKLRSLKKFPCPDCGVCFQTPGHLAQHQKAHKEERTFVCSECGKSFQWIGDFRRHRRTHTHIRLFICSECKKCFVQRNHLHSHQLCHTSKRPFSCVECGKRFALNAQLIQHLRRHNEDIFWC